jgi:hypothetical protein
VTTRRCASLALSALPIAMPLAVPVALATTAVPAAAQAGPGVGDVPPGRPEFFLIFLAATAGG